MNHQDPIYNLDWIVTYDSTTSESPDFPPPSRPEIADVIRAFNKLTPHERAELMIQWMERDGDRLWFMDEIPTPGENRNRRKLQEVIKYHFNMSMTSDGRVLAQAKYVKRLSLMTVHLVGHPLARS